MDKGWCKTGNMGGLRLWYSTIYWGGSKNVISEITIEILCLFLKATIGLSSNWIKYSFRKNDTSTEVYFLLLFINYHWCLNNKLHS